MQPDRNRAVIRMFVERIIAKAFPEETAAARLQQIGLFTLIYMLEDDPEPTTAARLAAMTGLADAQVIRQVRKLVARGLVKRTKILNRQGRGRAFRLTIKYGAKTRRLLQGLDKTKKGASTRVAPTGKKAPQS
jgi:DNA-binding MarR family transcriptional regulator